MASTIKEQIRQFKDILDLERGPVTVQDWPFLWGTDTDNIEWLENLPHPLEWDPKIQ